MKGLDNGNSAAYARFEEEVYILFLCNGEIDFLIILARSGIKPIVADLLDLLKRFI